MADGTVTITIDGRTIGARAGASVLEAALEAGVYVPHLCHHPSLGPARGARSLDAVYRAGERVEADPGSVDTASEGCGLCVVRVEGLAEPCPSCDLPAASHMVVATTTPELVALRRARLARLLATHPHACLTCAQKEGCSRTQCSANVPVAERCCELLGRCELEKVADYIGIPPETPRYIPRGLAEVGDEPLFRWRPELCVSCLRCVRACGDLKGVGAFGFVIQGGATVVGQVATDRDAAACRFCGACVEVCPTGALADRMAADGDRRLRLVPCRHSCPAGMDVPRFLRAIAREDLDEAVRVVLDRIPLPESLGRVCFHPCEEQCRRGELGGALSVCRLRRHVFEAAGADAGWPPAPRRGGRVAVIGAGPAGLAAAHFLRRLGRPVTVFEAAAEAGGMLRYGIPAYRLPPEALRRDLDRLARHGAEIRTGIALGDEITLDSLRREGFQAVLLAVGNGAAKALPVAGVELDGVRQGVELLRGVAAGEIGEGAFAGRRVLVVGGGNVAVDAARTAVRLGAVAVAVACLESREEMPAYAPEIAAAVDEGVEVLTSWGVGELLGSDGTVRGARLVRCVSVFDEAGRFAPRLDPTIAREFSADVVIAAIGQEVDRSFLRGCGGGLALTSGGLLSTGTGVEGVFACGDVTAGPSSVVRAVASGRAAAEAVDRWLGGSGEIPSLLAAEQPVQWLGRDEGFAGGARAATREVAIAERSGFREVDEGLPAEAVLTEAGRCLQCDLRLCLAPPILPPELWLALSDAEVAKVPAVEGVYRLLGDDRVATKIAGVADLRAALAQELDRKGRATHFVYEEDPMYSKRESELLQVFLARHGRMPAGGDDLDDLF